MVLIETIRTVRTPSINPFAISVTNRAVGGKPDQIKDFDRGTENFLALLLLMQLQDHCECVINNYSLGSMYPGIVDSVARSAELSVENGRSEA